MDQEMVRGCYWDDAIDDHHGFVGAPDAFIDRAFGYNETVSVVQHHGLNNHDCEIDGDNAWSETRCTSIGASKQPQHLLSIGRYIGHSQRRDGIWKMENRATVIEKTFDLHDGIHDAVTLAGDTSHGPLLHAARDRSDLRSLRPVVPRGGVAKRQPVRHRSSAPPRKRRHRAGSPAPDRGSGGVVPRPRRDMPVAVAVLAAGIADDPSGAWPDRGTFERDAAIARMHTPAQQGAA